MLMSQRTTRPKYTNEAANMATMRCIGAVWRNHASSAVRFVMICHDLSRESSTTARKLPRSGKRSIGMARKTSCKVMETRQTSCKMLQVCRVDVHMKQGHARTTIPSHCAIAQVEKLLVKALSKTDVEEQRQRSSSDFIHFHYFDAQYGEKNGICPGTFRVTQN